eukprot:g6302.t1
MAADRDSGGSQQSVLEEELRAIDNETRTWFRAAPASDEMERRLQLRQDAILSKLEELGIGGEVKPEEALVKGAKILYGDEDDYLVFSSDSEEEEDVVEAALRVVKAEKDAREAEAKAKRGRDDEDYTEDSSSEETSDKSNSSRRAGAAEDNASPTEAAKKVSVRREDAENAKHDVETAATFSASAPKKKPKEPKRLPTKDEIPIFTNVSAATNYPKFWIEEQSLSQGQNEYEKDQMGQPPIPSDFYLDFIEAGMPAAETFEEYLERRENVQTSNMQARAKLAFEKDEAERMMKIDQNEQPGGYAAVEFPSKIENNLLGSEATKDQLLRFIYAELFVRQTVRSHQHFR